MESRSCGLQLCRIPGSLRLENPSRIIKLCPIPTLSTASHIQEFLGLLQERGEFQTSLGSPSQSLVAFSMREFLPLSQRDEGNAFGIPTLSPIFPGADFSHPGFPFPSWEFPVPQLRDLGRTNPWSGVRREQQVALPDRGHPQTAAFWGFLGMPGGIFHLFCAGGALGLRIPTALGLDAPEISTIGSQGIHFGICAAFPASIGITNPG